jgi:hypothetical protein
MDALITKARKQYHAKLLTHNVLTIDKDGIPSNADKSSELSKYIARHIADSLMVEVHDKIQGQTSGAKFEQINMEYLAQTFPLLQSIRPGKWHIEKLGNRSQIKTSSFAQYAHLEALSNFVRQNAELAASLGNDYMVAPDVVIYREPEEDSEDSEGECEPDDGLSWSDRNAIEHKVCAVDEPHVRAKVHDFVSTLDDIQVAFVLATLTNCRYEYTECDADGNHTDKDESFLLHVGDEVGEKRQRDILEDEIVESVLGYSGVRNGDERGYFGCLPKDEAMQKAKELWESEKANEKETDDGEDGNEE